MKKLTQSAACTVCVTATTVPTFLASHSDSTIVPNQINTENLQPQPVKKKTFSRPQWKEGVPQLTSAKDIKSKDKYSESDCLKDQFTDIVWNENAAEEWSALKDKQFDQGTKGCLVVEHYRQEYTGSKWWNEFRLIWSLKDDTNKQGFITVLNITTENEKLIGSTAIYFLEQKENKWTSTHKKENENTDITDSSKLKKFIPQTSTITKTGYTLTDNWSFNPDLTKICGEDNCENAATGQHQFSGTWNFEKGNGKGTKVKEWCKDFDTWFKEQINWEGLGKTIENVTGSWKVPTA